MEQQQYGVVPMVEALNKMFVFYRDKGLDMFKDAISLPDLAYKMLLSCTPEKFSLFKEEDKVLGYDANALYLWAISEVMPTGDYGTITEYNLQQLKSDVMSDKLFGYVECDITVPEHLHEHFSEMCPIFKNIDIHGTKDVIGEHMFDYCTQNN